MYFEYTQALYLLFILVPLVWVLGRSRARTLAIAVVYKGRTPEPWYYKLKLFLSIVFISSLVLVAARPYIVSQRSGDFLFLIDVSRSMDARHSCGDLTFLDRSKNIMRSVLNGVPEARFGIFAFDRFAFPITQMTSNFEYLFDVIENGIHIGLTFEATRTELANALGVVAAKKTRLPNIYGKVNKLILISDGNIGGDYSRRLAEPLGQLRNSGIEVLVVGVGNPGETPIMVQERDRCINQNLEMDSEAVMIPMRDDVLKFIASEGQGQFFAEGNTESLVEAVRSGLVLIPAEEVNTGGGYRRDISLYFLAITTLALLGLRILGSNFRRRFTTGR
jgi:Ca-activated chloride channel family protein